MNVWSSLPDSSAPPGGARSLAIGFVTYRPDAGFYDRVPLACGLGHEVFVFDNAPEATDHRRLNANESPHVHYVTAGRNLGLGVGLSAVCASAYAHGCEYLLFFDQDTRVTAETLDYVKNFLQRHLPEIGGSHAVVTFEAPHGDSADHRPIDELLTISSGSLFLLHNVARMGWHNPRYFVDGVDYEFCLRARWQKFRVAVCSGAPGFDHVTDQADTTHKVFGQTMRLRRYPYSRVTDSLSAYLRLAATSLWRFDLRAFFSVVRSLAIFIVGQSLARIFLRRSK